MIATVPNGDRKIIIMGLHVKNVRDGGLYRCVGVDEVEKKGRMMGEEWGYPREPA